LRAEASLARLTPSIRQSFALRTGVGRPLLPLGHFANVLDLGQGLGLAISTDGVGTKALIAQMMDRYDTIGIDCVAMNVNDVACVGAEPIAMTDYIAVEGPDEELFGELGIGLLRGAEKAGITIPGGEIAQLPEIVRGKREGYGFDLVGTCVGLVPTDRILIGQDVAPGDVVVGLASSGVHSNGLTLARAALFDRGGLDVRARVPELDGTLGEELLKPTEIYVRFALAVQRADIGVKALVHITSDGFLNLARVEAPVSFVLDKLPAVPPIFTLIQRLGEVPTAEMFHVFNMGIGFCAIVSRQGALRACEIARAHGHEASIIGRVTALPSRTVTIPAFQLIGEGSSFRPM
jgi:phosphoribosylformylglycinamidine cyclo-ligase